MSISKQDLFVINTFCRILSDDRGRDMSIDVAYLIKVRIIRMSTARAKVIQTLYHEYKSGGLTAQQAVWRLSDEVGLSDPRVWAIVKSRTI